MVTSVLESACLGDVHQETHELTHGTLSVKWERGLLDKPQDMDSTNRPVLLFRPATPEISVMSHKYFKTSMNICVSVLHIYIKQQK